MSDRLKELQRQQALAREQAAALEREIAKEMGAAVPPPAAAPASQVDAVADELIERYNQKQRPIHDQVRSGCFVYFFTAFALVGLALVALYFYGHH